MSRRELEIEIVDLRLQNRYAALRLSNIQEDIDDFMAKYYEAVGDLCLEISTLESKYEGYSKKLRGEAPQISKIKTSETNFHILPRSEEVYSFEKEVKELYRKLVKITHPDVSTEKMMAAEYTRMVNEAYNEKNYRELLRLDQLINSGEATIKDLQQQKNQLVDSTHDLKAQYEQLKDSPMYVLRQKFAQEDDKGKSMIVSIRQGLKKRIAEEKRKLKALRIEYIESMGERIVKAGAKVNS
ncbi:MAG: hypothetical protein COV36_06985 [Alphaproteobacteria bacterium CG11_big_fil_rev_8_21_14_0_20_44_7]|nr:MAG: hypothetical protein COV36_06985 [Alphaproteobacteria bacterium CG11_big_fil_rev_8_21_14_0_20_44_7]